MFGRKSERAAAPKAPSKHMVLTHEEIVQLRGSINTVKDQGRRIKIGNLISSLEAWQNDIDRNPKEAAGMLTTILPTLGDIAEEKQLGSHSVGGEIFLETLHHWAFSMCIALAENIKSKV